MAAGIFKIYAQLLGGIALIAVVVAPSYAMYVFTEKSLAGMPRVVTAVVAGLVGAFALVAIMASPRRRWIDAVGGMLLGAGAFLTVNAMLGDPPPFINEYIILFAAIPGALPGIVVLWLNQRGMRPPRHEAGPPGNRQGDG